MKVWF